VYGGCHLLDFSSMCNELFRNIGGRVRGFFGNGLQSYKCFKGQDLGKERGECAYFHGGRKGEGMEGWKSLGSGYHHKFALKL